MAEKCDIDGCDDSAVYHDIDHWCADHLIAHNEQAPDEPEPDEDPVRGALDTQHRRAAFEAFIADHWPPGSVVTAFYGGWYAGRAEERSLTAIGAASKVDAEGGDPMSQDTLAICGVCGEYLWWNGSRVPGTARGLRHYTLTQDAQHKAVV